MTTSEYPDQTAQMRKDQTIEHPFVEAGYARATHGSNWVFCIIIRAFPENITVWVGGRAHTTKILAKDR